MTASLWIISLVFLAVIVIFNVKSIRSMTITKLLFGWVKKVAPTLSKTEEEALKAGMVGFEGELFSGRPDFKKMLSNKSIDLNKEEENFLNGPTEELCSMLHDWQIFQDQDLSPQIWEFIKSRGFFSMIIPKKYGGLEFSSYAQSSVILKIGSRNLPAAITVGVPNSLGPAELLLKYGTEDQKDLYLPRLASGEEIPCFALTGPDAGSDASSIPDFGIVCYQDFYGKRTLGVLLNWNKRYITLAPVATLIGLAFKLRDPHRILSKEVERGITCALIPRDLPGIEIGKRHNPLNIMFQNGPIMGRDVFIPLDLIIGGEAMIGHGWRMLMESLGVGRAVMLPSAGSSSAMVAALASGCYARIRHQFGLPIGRFEGVMEPLARIGANAYLNMATLKFVLSRIDLGERSAVASAIVKYHTTERARQSINDAMDIHGGKGICLGPKNYLNQLFQSAPINITVEGANILTRNLIIFGQGAIRCHPFILKEMKAISTNDLIAFDEVFFGHVRYLLSNFSKCLLHALTGSYLIRSPKSSVAKRFKKIVRYSIALGFISDVALIMIGGNLKRKENLSARLGDVLSDLYLASACLKRFHDDAEPESDMPIVNYLCQSLFLDIEHKFRDVFSNWPNKLVGCLLYLVVFPWGARLRGPTDRETHDLAQLMLYPNESFQRMTAGLYRGSIDDNFITTLEDVQRKVVGVEELEKRVRQALKQNRISGLGEEDLVKDALLKNVIDAKEAEQLLEVARLRAEVIAVDAYHDALPPVGPTSSCVPMA